MRFLPCIDAGNYLRRFDGSRITPLAFYVTRTQSFPDMLESKKPRERHSMNRRTFLIAASFASIVSLAGLTGCLGAAAGSNGNGNGNGNGSNATNDSSNSSSYQQDDAETAKEIMDTKDDYVILDARTQAEYDEGHIPGAILIPHDTVATAAEDALPDKGQLILVYCRSGNRSKQASQALVDLGYTNVVEFGGINSWPYEVE